MTPARRFPRSPEHPRAPRVSCHDCGFAWHSAAQAEGLRLISGCPRCGGHLRFADAAAAPAPTPPTPAPPPTEPHLVLGVPRTFRSD